MKYFLVSNLAECLLYSKGYTGTHIPFVLNIHDFSYFDIRGAPFVTIGHFMEPQETRQFCNEYLNFLRRFVDEMDQRNAVVARTLFGSDLKLFSAIAYEIFWTFYSVFRLVACVHSMRTKSECEILIPFSLEDSHPMEAARLAPTNSLNNDNRVFKITADYFTDLTNLKIEKVSYTSNEKCNSRNARGRKRGFVKFCGRKVQHIYTRFVRQPVKYKQYVLNMAMDNLWAQVLNSTNVINIDGPIGMISVDELIQDDVSAIDKNRLKENPEVRLFRTDCKQDKFINHFRCKEFIQDVLFERYEAILKQAIPQYKAIKDFIMTKEICAAIGTAWGATFINALTSQLAAQRKVPVVGMQHGGHYGYMDFFDKLGYSDYYACDHWFSWGFDGDYFKKVFRHSIPTYAKIVPVGSVEICSLKKNREKSQKRQAQIIYPMVNNIELMRSTFRTDDFKLYNFQKKILERLLASKKEIIIKPHAGFRLALDRMLTNLPRNVSISAKPLVKLYAKYDFEWVIIDFLSTPFEQACVTQAQILAFNDSAIWPIEPSASQAMLKRAWMFDEETKYLEVLDRILAGEVLERRMDNSFEKEFVLPYGERTIDVAREELRKVIINAKSIHKISQLPLG